jgi:hypothetical protein
MTMKNVGFLLVALMLGKQALNIVEEFFILYKPYPDSNNSVSLEINRANGPPSMIL